MTYRQDGSERGRTREGGEKKPQFRPRGSETDRNRTGGEKKMQYRSGNEGKNQTRSGITDNDRKNQASFGKPGNGRRNQTRSEKPDNDRRNQTRSEKPDNDRRNQTRSEKTGNDRRDKGRAVVRGGAGKTQKPALAGRADGRDKQKPALAGRADGRDKQKPERSALCSAYPRCGGCQYLTVSYQEQLAIKQKQTEKLLSAFGRVEKITGMEEPAHYRNKVHAVFGHRKDGTVISGTYEEGTHFIVPVDSCLLENEQADAIIRDIRGLLKSFRILTYNEDTGYGLLRHVLIRCGRSTGQIMVALVLASPILPSRNNFVKALREMHPEITTIILNVNDQSTSMILGEKETVLYGKGYIEDILCERTFRISSKSFYQINPVQTEKLYAKAIELADLSGKETVLDAYCGIGTIGLIAAGKAARVMGVELNRDAVRDAIINAKRNGITNVRFTCADATDYICEMAEDNEKVDVIFMDPPRSGSTEQFLEAAASAGAGKIVYISCNPETQARDLKYLTKRGYKVKEIWPFDLFPFTTHIETVCLLTHS